MKSIALILATIFSLSACAGFKSSIPETYAGPKSVIKDSVNMHSDSKGDFFYVDAVDGNDIEQSRSATLAANRNRGMRMTPRILQREVPARPIKLSIVGRTEYAAPILAMVNTVYQVKGVVEFTPEKDKTYIVRGDLGNSYSAVWIEEESSKNLIGQKFEIHGPAKLGFLGK